MIGPEPVAPAARARIRTTASRGRVMRGRVMTGVVALLAAATAFSIGCSEVGTGISEPAAIELSPFPAPAVVIGDTLRDLSGKIAPIAALVRNVRGEIITDAPVRYLYADAPRDSAIVVDSVTGIVRALRAMTSDNGRIAARVGGNLQVLRTIIVTTRPDSIDAIAVGTLLETAQPDTGRERARINTSQPLTATVRHKEGAVVSGVNAWLVQFVIVKPANPTNDTTGAAFLVNESGTASAIDTTDGSGAASRRVRVRAAQFPAAIGVDSVIVEARSSYKGVPLKVSPARIALPVRRGS